MAHKEVPMSLRRLIAEVDPASMNVTEFCRVHGISTWLFWQLRRRFAAEGEAGLVPRSRAPHTVANKTPLQVEDAIVRARKELGSAGLDAGAASIRFKLNGLAGLPSEATIWRILHARGLIVPEPAKAPKHAGRRFEAERANECWPLDDTSWELADGTPVKAFNVLDDHSRLAVACRAMPVCTTEAALDTLADAASVLGWPERILSDCAAMFRHGLANAVALLGVGARHTRPFNPRCNGKVERFHQTEKRWLEAQPRAATLAEFQTQLDLFRFIYNHQRPHRAIGRRFPADVWEAAPKSGPATRPLTTPTTVHHDTVSQGSVHAGRYTIAVGRRFEAQPALIVTTGIDCHVFVAGRLARRLTINPDQKHQPLNTRRGRPPSVREDPRHA
jgi:transposase InsO family protein